jgi:phosphocarrier protein HPr
MAEARETVQIVNQRGLHARASAKFVNAVAKLADDRLRVMVHKDGAEAAGGSILGLMMLGAAKGDSIEIVVSGEGAETALAKLAGLVKDGFGED